MPPHTHRSNISERAIQTFKAHFKAGLASVHPAFPVSQWDLLLEQAVITLNLLRVSRMNKHLSAHAYLYGNFNYSATPLLPPGTKVIAHSPPSNRATWDFNGEEGWYVGPSMKHYRCVQVYFPRTKRTRPVQQLDIVPHDIPIPQVKLEDFLSQAATDIIRILQSPPSTTSVSLAAGDPTRNAILELATILQRKASIPPLQHNDALAPRVQNNDVALPRVKNLLNKKEFLSMSLKTRRIRFHRIIS